jgi:hypothetical protein
MTAVEYIFEQLEEQGLIFLTTKTNEMTISISASDYLDIKRLSKEMEKQQIIEAAERWKGTDFAEQYYNETYGSKGSDETLKEYHIVDSNEMVSSQTEISDEEIEKAVNDPNHDAYDFREGAKWYRGQLKKKQ